MNASLAKLFSIRPGLRRCDDRKNASATCLVFTRMLANWYGCPEFWNRKPTQLPGRGMPVSIAASSGKSSGLKAAM
jgi:hypothetical protein